MNKKINAGWGVVVIGVIALAVGVFVWKTSLRNSEPGALVPTQKPTACTMEAKLCPDGSYVSRSGPNCEFAACPKNDSLKDKIIISSPNVDQEISSPVSVSGQARGGWFFEGTFPVEVYDSNDKLLGSGPAVFFAKNSSDTWMTDNFVDFSGKIKFSETKTASGYVLFKKDNPSGDPATDESLRVEVKFKPADAANEYKNDQYGFILTFPDTWQGYVTKSRILDWGSDGQSDSVDFGLPGQEDGLFNISFFKEKQYNSIMNSGVPFGMLLGKNSDYVFVWNQAQYAANSEMAKRMSEVPDIVKTFKLIN